MLRSFTAFRECTIGATDGDIGQVKDLYFDDQSWTARYFVVDTGSWLSGRTVLVSPIAMRQADWPAHRLPAALTREQVRNSPGIDTDKPVSRQHEVEMLGYYGYAYYWGGTGSWGGGMAPTALDPGSAASLGNAVGPQAVADQGDQASRARQREDQREDDTHLRSCSAVVGYHIAATDGEVGHVEGYLIDDETWTIRYLVVDTSNWWLGHQVLVAPQWIAGVHWSDRTVSVDLSRAAVQASPDYEPSAILDRHREADLYDHHGRPPYWKAASRLEREI